MERIKFSMLFGYKNRVGVCSASVERGNVFALLLLKLTCFLRFKIQINYTINKNCEGWEKEYIGKSVKVNPIKIFLFKEFNKAQKIRMVDNYLKNGKNN